MSRPHALAIAVAQSLRLNTVGFGEFHKNAFFGNRGAGRRVGRLRVFCFGYRPAYVSPVAYQSYTCQQLALEAQAISTRAATLSGAQDSQRTKDGVATAATIVVFWPAAFFVGGDKQIAAELSQ